MSTRNIKKEDVMMQRRATHAAIEMHSKTRRRSHTSPAHISLAKQPMNHRMSRAGSIFRGQLVQQIEEAAKQDSEGDDTTGTALGLIARLRSLGLASVEMEGDGNCQFRAIADQLFGSQSHHAFVRSLAVGHMKTVAADFFSIYFESEAEFNAYLKDMGRSRTWGDELTLRACVEAFGCVAHVITSEAANWYACGPHSTGRADP